MSKYNRALPVISTTNDNYWFNQIKDNLEKSAVQPVSDSIFNQINSIVNTKSKHKTVASVVEEMKQRSGLTDYLKKQELNKVSEQVNNEKTASEHAKNMPSVIKKCPSILRTFENYIRDTNGNLPIPAIIDKVKSIHYSDVPVDKDWEEDNLLHLVSQLNLHAKKNNPNILQHYTNLGVSERTNDMDLDPSNIDAFHALMPVKL
jgi:hypothetical protein